MDALSGLAQGFAVALTPINLFWCLLGTTLGTAIGVLPGLGPAVTIALLLPITFKVDATAAFIMFAGIYYGAMYGGSTTSILLNTPGESATIVTALEGNRMAKRGRAGAAGAAAGHDRNPHRTAHRRRDLEVVPVPGAIAIHAREHDLAGAELLHPAGPGHGVESRRHAAAVDEHLPHLAAVTGDPLGVDVHHRRAAAEPVGDGGDEFRRANRRRVDAHLLGARLHEPRGVVERGDPTADGERHVDRLGDPANDVEHDRPPLVAGGDVEEHELVGPLGLVAGGDRHRIAGIDEVEELRPLHDPAPLHVEAGDDPSGERHPGRLVPPIVPSSGLEAVA